MPFIVRKVVGKKCYEVINELNGLVHVRCTTKQKARYALAKTIFKYKKPERKIFT